MNSNINKNKIYTIITVRTSSTRLPKKCLRFINKERVIQIIINRAKKIGYPIILATTKNKADLVLCNLAIKNKILYFRGSEKNVLKRWCDCFKKYKVDIAIIVDADDLLFDYITYKNAISVIIKKNFDYIKSNKNSLSGLFTYILKANIIKKIFEKNKKKNIETIEPYLKNNNFKFYSLKLKKNDNMRFTLDYKEDLIFFKKIFSKFPFTVKTSKVIYYLKKFKEISKINYFRQKDYITNQKEKYEKLQRLEI
jgi:spore coat polysaccharide biosynthesis protein SpsF